MLGHIRILNRECEKIEIFIADFIKDFGAKAPIFFEKFPNPK